MPDEEQHSKVFLKGNTIKMRLRRSQILVAIIFLGFFAFSNYFLGFLSFGEDSKHTVLSTNNDVVPGGKDVPKSDLNIDAEIAKLEQWKNQIEKQSAENQKIRDALNQPRKEPIIQEPTRRDKPVDKGVRAPPTKVPVVADIDTAQQDKDEQEEERMWKENEAKCHYKRDRDYEANPIIISGRFDGRFEPCDIPCVGRGGANADAGVSQGGRCTKSIFFTMENQAPAAGTYDIVANTDLNSDVPLPYFNWVEYNFKTPIKPKTATAHVAAFISNCGPQKRLNWMKTMMEHGVTIHSYGSCMRNTEIPASYRAQYGADYNAIKMAIVSTYKFTMSFENSGTKDYVTEKLFGVLAAGSVPLYDGAPNGKIFGPSEKSMLFADDFETAENMAKYILYLDSNDTAYNEYLAWKSFGPSDDFTALMDIGNVHSSCRLCIRTADMHRREVGPVTTVPKEIVSEEKPAGASIAIRVRERGKFWMRNIYLQERTYDELKRKIEQYVPHADDAYVYNMYEYWGQKDIKTDRDVKALTRNSEVEVVYVVPQIWNR